MEALGTAVLYIGGFLETVGGGSAAAGAALTASAATTVGTSIYSAKQQSKAQAAEQRRFEAQKRISSIRDAKERQRDVRIARIQRAKNEAAGQVSGAGQESSGLQGTLANIGTQQGANLAFRNQIGSLQNQVAQEDINIFETKEKRLVSGAIGKVSGTIFDLYGGAQQLGKNIGATA